MMFATGNIYRQTGTTSKQISRQPFKSSNETTSGAIKTPVLHTLGICSKIEVEKVEISLQGFETFAIFLLISYFTSVTTRVWNMYCCTVAAMGRISLPYVHHTFFAHHTREKISGIAIFIRVRLCIMCKYLLRVT